MVALLFVCDVVVVAVVDVSVVVLGVLGFDVVHLKYDRHKPGNMYVRGPSLQITLPIQYNTTTATACIEVMGLGREPLHSCPVTWSYAQRPPKGSTHASNYVFSSITFTFQLMGGLLTSAACWTKRGYRCLPFPPPPRRLSSFRSRVGFSIPAARRFPSTFCQLVTPCCSKVLPVGNRHFGRVRAYVGPYFL